MQNLITHIQEWEGDVPSYAKNIITYDPLPESDKGTLPLQRPYSTHPQFRPTIKRGLFDNPNAHLPGEQPCKDLEHDDLLELFGYDEERGCSRIELEQGTEIEIPIEDEQGVTSWIAGEVSICHEGSLDFRAEFPGSILETGVWRQTRSRADMDVTWRLPPALRKRHPATHMILNTQGYTPWHHPRSGSHWLRLQPRGAWTYGDHMEMADEQNRTYGEKQMDSGTPPGTRQEETTTKTSRPGQGGENKSRILLPS